MPAHVRGLAPVTVAAAALLCLPAGSIEGALPRGLSAALAAQVAPPQDTTSSQTPVPIYLAVEVPGAPSTIDPNAPVVSAPGVSVTIRGVTGHQLAGASIRISVRPPARSPVILSATVDQSATFRATYTPNDLGDHAVEAVDPTGRYRGTASFSVSDPAAAAEQAEVPQDEVEETAAALADIVCQAAAILAQRVSELPSSPASDELKRQLQEIDRDGRETVPCGEAPQWVSGVYHLTRLQHIDPALRPAIAPAVLEFRGWLPVAQRARAQAPAALAELTTGNVVCDQLDIIVNGLKFIDFYLGLMVKPSQFLQGWAKGNIPTKLVGMIPAVRRTPAVKEGIELGWKGVTTYNPRRVGGKVTITTKDEELALGHMKMVNATLTYAASRVLELYCERFQGPIAGSLNALFKHDGRLWWSFTTTFVGQLTLRYPRNARGPTIPLTGEFVGNATRFHSWDDAIPVLFPKLAQGTVFSSFRLEPFDMGDFGGFLAPNFGVGGSNPALDLNPITSMIEQGGVLVQYVLTPAFFRIPVRGELTPTTLRLELGQAAIDFDDASTRVIRIMLPVLSLWPEVAKYALPYKGARFILSRAMADGPVDLTVQRNGSAMVIERTFDLQRGGDDAMGVYHLDLKACNPGCDIAAAPPTKM